MIKHDCVQIPLNILYSTLPRRKQDQIYNNLLIIHTNYTKPLSSSLQSMEASLIRKRISIVKYLYAAMIVFNCGEIILYALSLSLDDWRLAHKPHSIVFTSQRVAICCAFGILEIINLFMLYADYKTKKWPIIMYGAMNLLNPVPLFALIYSKIEYKWTIAAALIMKDMLIVILSIYMVVLLEKKAKQEKTTALRDHRRNELIALQPIPNRFQRQPSQLRIERIRPSPSPYRDGINGLETRNRGPHCSTPLDTTMGPVPGVLPHDQWISNSIYQERMI